MTNSFNWNVIIDLYLLTFLVCCWEKRFSVAEMILQLFLLLSTMFYSQDVVENVVAKGGGFLLVLGSRWSPFTKPFCDPKNYANMVLMSTNACVWACWLSNIVANFASNSFYLISSPVIWINILPNNPYNKHLHFISIKFNGTTILFSMEQQMPIR
jgi:hypothetical protein